MNFFNKIPIINYNNDSARNILARAKLSDTTKSNRKAFLPYTMNSDDRIDNLSQAYYDSPNYTWLIWFANDIIDPYYDLPISEYDLQQYIINKYGSFDTAMRKVAYFKLNWKEDDRRISSYEFENLTDSQQKYWAPVLDNTLNVKEYKRKQDDQKLNTNRIASITINTANGTFSVGEEVQYDGTNYGFCTYASNTAITVQHVTGAFTANTIITGTSSGATAFVVEANNAVSVTAAYTDAEYWQPVSFFDYEIEENESKKEIYLLDAQLRSQAESELKRVMTNI